MDEVKRDLSDYSRSILLATRLVSTSLYIFIACFSIKRLCDVLSIFDGFIILMVLFTSKHFSDAHEQVILTGSLVSDCLGLRQFRRHFPITVRFDTFLVHEYQIAL
ncbi:hypothetical protein TGAMA5MH_04674 [Trichoderma gamsii]|uniref:Uncharacterized protein n=1 Tax=Trichoderma gamsii TaxID=398673 RepID=A0A2K0TDU8_9HYPO|nr:hypothetical protein TGAMA5MH_04674 [Trichoderma gamsii]